MMHAHAHAQRTRAQECIIEVDPVSLDPAREFVRFRIDKWDVEPSTQKYAPNYGRKRDAW